MRADRRLEIGLAFRADGDAESACDAIAAAIELAPHSAELWFALGDAAEAAGDGTRAAAAFRRCRDLDPADPFGAGARLALLGAMPPPDRLPPAHVARLFDDYAGRFDSALRGSLGYVGPERLRAALLAEGGDDPGLGRWRTLDLGCGTGLVGAALKDLTGRLEGVDLSAAMLARARRRGVYDALRCADLVEALADDSGPYDLIVAADTLIYLGDLASIFVQVRRCLAPGGRFALTLEKADAAGWHLQPSQRYAHAPVTVAAWAAAADFEIAHWEDAPLRQEGGAPVPSLLYVLRPRGAAETELGPLADAARRERPDA